jgi:hypothetical protein
MIPFLKEASCEGRTGRASSTRFIAIVAGASLAFDATLISITLCLAVVLKTEAAVVASLAGVLMALGPSLAGLAGLAYGAQRWATKDAKAKTDE